MTTLWKIAKGDIVVLWAKVRCVREDGSLDLEIAKDKLVFGVKSKLVALAAEPEEEEDYDGMD